MAADVGGEAIFVRCYSQQYPISEQTVRAMSWFVNLPVIGWVRWVFLSDINQAWKQTGIKSNIKYYLQKTVTNLKKIYRYKISANITFKQRYSQRKINCDIMVPQDTLLTLPSQLLLWHPGLNQLLSVRSNKSLSLFQTEKICVDSEFLLSCGEPAVKIFLHPAGSLIHVVGDDILAQTLSKTTVTFPCHSNRPDFAVRLSDQRKGWLLPASITPASPRAPTEDRVAAVMRRFYALKLQVLRVVCLKGISAQRAVLTGIVTVQMHKQQQTLVSPTYPRGSTIDFK